MAKAKKSTESNDGKPVRRVKPTAHHAGLKGQGAIMLWDAVPKGKNITVELWQNAQRHQFVLFVPQQGDITEYAEVVRDPSAKQHVTD